MTEQELREILGGPVEVPDVVEEKMAAAYARLQAGERRPVRRRGLRTALALAAAAAVLCAGAAAGYWITRTEVAVDERRPAVVEGLFGDSSRPSVEEQTKVEADGSLSLNLPNRERVPVELPEALAVVGDYLPDTGYAWNVGDYTLTVEAYLLDQGTGTGKIYFLLELPGTESLSAVTAVDPDSGERGAVLSAIGIAIDAQDVDEIDSVVLHYADGSSYVVRDENQNLDNTEYALGCGSGTDMTLRLCFNRLVDPAQVMSVTVNGRNCPTA